MFNELEATNAIAGEAGLEVDKLMRSYNKVGGAGDKADRVLMKLEDIARSLPHAVMTLNRAAESLAAYRLEYAKSGNHEKAVQYAKDMTNSTEGNYSATNAAPIFNHPLGRITLQFRKYGAMVYSLIGQTIGKAWRNENPGDRAEAIKTLINLTASHVLLAGTLGLPSEPIKALMIGAHAAGLTAHKFSDIEEWEREFLAHTFGKTLGEGLAHGVTSMIPGGFGFNAGTRLGADHLFLPLSEPSTTGDKDIKAWLMEAVGGASGGALVDTLSGVNDAMNGDWGKAAQKIIPVKFLSNVAKAVNNQEGKKNATGNTVMSGYSPQESLMRVIGFTPNRESEIGEARAAFNSSSREASADRSRMVHSWVNASAADKAASFKTIQLWNKGKSAEQQIQMKDLTGALARTTKTEAGPFSLGVTKRNAEFKKTMDIYNTGQ